MIKNNNRWWLVSILIIFVIVSVTVGLHLNSNQKEIDVAKTGLTKIINDAGLSKSKVFCEYGFGRNILGSGAGTRYIMYFLFDQNQNLDIVSNSITKSGFKADGFTQELKLGTETTFSKYGSELSGYKEYISATWTEAGGKPYENCESTMDYSYVVPENKNLLEISYIVSK